MRVASHYVRLAGLTFIAVVTAACSGDSAAGPSASLTIYGSASAPPPASGSLGAALARYAPLTSFGVRTTVDAQSGDGGVVVGGPSKVSIGLYALYLSQNTDCSNPVLVEDNGATAVVKDFTQNPVLFTGTPPNGSYHCIIFRFSDVIGFESASSGGLCQTNTPYLMDIYRAPDTDWIDVNDEHIVASGSDDAPSDDHVYVFASTDPEALLARGVSPHQILPLSGALAVPGTGTFYWDATNTVGYDSQRCGMNPPQLSFR